MKSWRLIIPTIALLAGMALPSATSYAATSAPAAPGNVMAWAGDQSVRVTWEPPVISVIYRLSQYQINVYQDGLPVQIVQFPAPATEKVVAGLANYRTYTFTVQVKQRSPLDTRLESDWSVPSGFSNPVIPPGGSLPSAPSRFEAYGANSAAMITWAAPTSSSQLTTYQLTAYKAGGVFMVQRVRVASASPTAAWITNLENGQSYRFTVQAANTAGWGPEAPLSNPAISPSSAMLPGPIVTSIVPGDGSLTLQWFGPLSPNIDHYLVLTGSQDGTLVTYRDHVVSPLVINGLTNGITYIVEVRAVTTQHMMSTAARFQIVLPASIQPPIPANLRFALNDRAVALYWDTPAANSTAPIDHYAVSVFLDSVQVWTNGNVRATSIAVPGLLVGQTYVAEVRSVSVANAMSDSAMVRFTAATIQDAPANVQATIDRGQAVVTWTPPTFDGATPITGYLVQGSSGLATESIAITAGPNQTSATFGNLMLGRTYTFTVQALNVVGGSPLSAPSNPVTIATVPGFPRNLSVGAGDESAILRWDAPVSDGGSPILGYQVTASDGLHSPVVVFVTGTSVTLTGLTNGVTYTVSVMAKNAVGLGSQSSAVATPRNLAPVITAPVALSVHHGDMVSANVTASDPEWSDHLALTATGLPNGVTFTDKGNGMGLLSGFAEVPAGTYSVTFTVNDAHNPPVSQSMTLTVTREQAEVRLFSTAPLSVMLTEVGQTQARSLTIRATIREVTDPNGNADIGEAANVSYTLTSLFNGTTYTGKAATIGGGVEGTLTTKYTFRNIPRGIYELRISVGGNYYQGTAEAMVAVSSSAVHGGVTGTGQMLVPGSNTSAHFQFKAQRLGIGKLSGSLLYVEQQAGEVYTFQSTSITALVFKGHTAYIQGMGTLNGVGQHQFVATIVDNHLQARADRFGLRVIDGNFATVNDCTFRTVDLTSGQARIVHG